MDMKNIEKLQLKKGDYFLLLGVFLVVVILLVVNAGNQQGNKVHVTVGDKTTTYSLAKNQKINISNCQEEDVTIGDCSIINIILIEDGMVSMGYATCPDQVCVKHKSISKNGEMIICLPNQVFVEIENDIDSEIDN